MIKSFLFDTHILIWSIFDDERLSSEVRYILENEDNGIWYSIISILEIKIKNQVRPGDINLNGESVVHFCEEMGFRQLPLTLDHVLKLGSLKRVEDAPRHKDPFDRLLICQAIGENMFFVTHDKLLQYYQCGNILIV
ncbi:MAG: type II toxin-antitoxin system VapC family toxin [Selenomonadaceae bacterium]|nr:type II toxin-antitoxin system VapC family toxin [Selenomonadaceae bacterium]